MATPTDQTQVKIFPAKSFFEQGDTPQLRKEEKSKTLQRRSNINLQKSIQLLDDAVSPSVARTGRTPRSGLRHSTYTPKKFDPKYSHDVSESFSFTPAKKQTVFNTTAAGSPRLQIFSPDVTVRMELTESIPSSEMIIGDSEEQTAATELFERFSSTLKMHNAPHQVMDLLSDYEALCSVQARSMKKVSRAVTRNQMKFHKTMSTCEVLQQEKESWKLLHSLFKDRLEAESRDAMEGNETDMETPDVGVWALSEQNIVNRLFEKDDTVRQSQLVIDWLETCASENLDEYDRKAKFFLESPVAWENTLHYLQKNKQGFKSSSDRIVSEIDPDAPTRQRKCLDDLDQNDERIFLQNLFILIRAGELEKAEELCRDCGQPWRAASLEGWRLLHDANYYSKTIVGDVVPVEGNPNRNVWKGVCWNLANQLEFDKHERAVYAVLSGNLDAILPVCSSWMDYVWSYFKVMVDVKVEQEIRLHRKTDRDLESLPDIVEEKILDPQNVFREIAASVDETVRLQSENWYHVLQKYVILGDIPGLIEVMYSWLQSDRDSLPKHLVRFMAHVVLFLRSINRTCKKEMCESILSAYVEDLIRNKHREIVAHYVSTLSPPAQVQWYATFLEDIEGLEERQRCLSLAEAEGLDIALITKTVVERVRARDTSAFLPEEGLAPDLVVTEEDRAKIEAIDWLIFDPAHRPEAVRQANAIMRSFIAVKKYAAAREVFEKLPSDSSDVIHRLWHRQTGSDDLPPSDSNAIREYLCMSAYLDAVESFNDWFNLYHQGRPTKPSGAEGNSFTDRVAFEHKMKQYESEKERWLNTLLVQTKTTKDRIYNVLLFLDGGWLVDAFEEFDKDEQREHQLEQLRKLHLPGLCLNLHSMLHSSGRYAEAVQIADVIASEQHKLYKVFDQESLQHLLSQICKSSYALLDENKDPLGYEIV